ncbi:MAG: TIGR01841 family phasin [Pseudomonadota bacterium]
MAEASELPETEDVPETKDLPETKGLPATPADVVEKMTESFEAAAKEFDGSEFDGLKFDAEVPESVRSMAESTINQTREAYERSKEALDEQMDALERALDAAGHGAAALNRKFIDITQRNLNSGFDFAKTLAGAKTLAEIMELQSGFLRDQFEVLSGQATEIQELSKKIATDTSERPPVLVHSLEEAVEVVPRRTLKMPLLAPFM